jgi:rSAM/selenodomain-associated transferase 2
MRVSVIIPALNEAANLAAAVASVRLQAPHQIIVVDGGSTDQTREIGAAIADELIEGVRGRAAQMNLGATRATGEILLFLHADSRLEVGALTDARRILSNRRVAAGCFTMTVPLGNPMFRSIEWCATARVRLTGYIYGDQGLFLRRETFDRVGGFPPLRFMEDLAISRALRRQGRVQVSRRRVMVSPRRWQERGIVRQTLRNWWLTALAAAGVHPDRLAHYYPASRPLQSAR